VLALSPVEKAERNDTGSVGAPGEARFQRGGLAVLIFWLAVVFVSFSLFSRLTPINIVATLVFSISASQRCS
jgi:hypothetical protein